MHDFADSDTPALQENDPATTLLRAATDDQGLPVRFTLSVAVPERGMIQGAMRELRTEHFTARRDELAAHAERLHDWAAAALTADLVPLGLYIAEFCLVLEDEDDEWLCYENLTWYDNGPWPMTPWRNPLLSEPVITRAGRGS